MDSSSSSSVLNVSFKRILKCGLYFALGCLKIAPILKPIVKSLLMPFPTVDQRLRRFAAAKREIPKAQPISNIKFVFEHVRETNNVADYDQSKGRRTIYYYVGDSGCSSTITEKQSASYKEIRSLLKSGEKVRFIKWSSNLSKFIAISNEEFLHFSTLLNYKFRREEQSIYREAGLHEKPLHEQKNGESYWLVIPEGIDPGEQSSVGILDLVNVARLMGLRAAFVLYDGGPLRSRALADMLFSNEDSSIEKLVQVDLIVPISELVPSNLVKFFVKNKLNTQVRIPNDIASSLTSISQGSSSAFAAISPANHMNESEVDLSSYEKKYWSQNGEDGVLLKIFEVIGAIDKYFVEFGTDNGTECNTRYLRQKCGWQGLMMDGSHSNPLINFYEEFITAENINDLFRKYHVPREFDLLSIDLDSNDLWVWNALDSDYKPRVIVVEYSSWLGPHDNKVVVYNPTRIWDKTYYAGASIAALHKLGRKKGYSLVYAENRGVNLFFIRDDVLQDLDSIFKDTNDVEKIFKKQTYQCYMYDEKNRQFTSFN